MAPPRPTPPLPACSVVRAGASSPLPGPLLRLSVAVSSAAGTELPGPHPAFNPMRLDVPGTASRLSEAARVDPCPHVPKCVFLSSWFQAGGWFPRACGWPQGQGQGHPTRTLSSSGTALSGRVIQREAWAVGTAVVTRTRRPRGAQGGRLVTPRARSAGGDSGGPCSQRPSSSAGAALSLCLGSAGTHWPAASRVPRRTGACRVTPAQPCPADSLANQTGRETAGTSRFLSFLIPFGLTVGCA